MTYHILNGDALIDRFLATGLDGEMVVARECLIEGDLEGDTLPQFWQTRAKYLGGVYNEQQQRYFDDVASQFEKLLAAPDPSEFNLWFGHDLFCQANMWFTLSLLDSLSIKKDVFVVYPSFLEPEHVWKEFGGATTNDLITAYRNRTRFHEEDLKLGTELWTAYKNHDFGYLKNLSTTSSPCFPYLKEVCQAHIDRFPVPGMKGRPERVIEEILQHSSKEFHVVFSEFSKREGIYGFGDSQLKDIYNRVLRHR